ncbi:hypothetical protein [Mycobacterium ostraviense]|uniref:hypothetical protein n=1 Tax=Mycobacterium ostraviense TaxID=2738409 RepID=UPI000A59A006|nr:hypothetical protein [Mycobacterium ostraviense]UGT91788.1 hypothetical protein LTS72_27485 [Mycobacterium ostraviense]
MWTLYEVAVCSGALGKPDYGLPAALEAVTLAERTGNPTARSMAYFALGYLLKRSEPVRATALFDKAAQLAAAVQNFWHSGTALMSAAATRAVHGDPIEAARMFIEVLDHLDRVGDWFEQGAALRYITRLFGPIGRRRRCRLPPLRVYQGGHAVAVARRTMGDSGRPFGHGWIRGAPRLSQRQRRDGGSGSVESAPIRHSRWVRRASSAS